MRWRRLGRIFEASGQQDWMRSHALLPFAEPLDRDRFRIWFSPRDAENRSHVAWLEIDIKRPEEVLHLPERPTLAPGPRGAFDDCGTTGSWLVETPTRRNLFYNGWNRSPTVWIGRPSCRESVCQVGLVPGGADQL